MRKIILVLALCVCGIASAQAQTSGTNAPPPPVCSASNAGALYTQTSTSPNTVWTCSYYNLQYQWVVNPMYGGLAYYPIVPTTCSGALPVFLAGYPTTTMYVCIQGVPTAVAGGGANITSLTGDATAAGPGAAATTVTGINGAAIQASINVLSTNASKQVVGATYQNVVNLFGSGSCSGYLKSDGTCSTPSSIPTGTTNQLLYYASSGNTLTPLNLGTNLSITSGTLNATGGSSVNVNGSAVTNPNFNDTTPAAPTGNLNVNWQFDSSGDVSAYVDTCGTNCVITNPAASQTINQPTSTSFNVNSPSIVLTAASNYGFVNIGSASSTFENGIQYFNAASNGGGFIFEEGSGSEDNSFNVDLTGTNDSITLHAPGVVTLNAAGGYYGSELAVSRNISLPLTIQTASYKATQNNHFIVAAGGTTVTIGDSYGAATGDYGPPPVGAYQTVVPWPLPATVTVVANGTQVINGQSSYTITSPTTFVYTGVTGNEWLVTSPIGGAGTVTSVAQTVPSWLAVSGSPVTSSGTLAISAATGQTANEFLATPNGSTGAVGLRAIAGGDFSGLTGCTTSGYVFSPAGDDCVAASAGGATFAYPGINYATSASAATLATYIQFAPQMFDSEQNLVLDSNRTTEFPTGTNGPYGNTIIGFRSGSNLGVGWATASVAGVGANNQIYGNDNMPSSTVGADNFAGGDGCMENFLGYVTGPGASAGDPTDGNNTCGGSDTDYNLKWMFEETDLGQKAHQDTNFASTPATTGWTGTSQGSVVMNIHGDGLDRVSGSYIIGNGVGRYTLGPLDLSNSVVTGSSQLSCVDGSCPAAGTVIENDNDSLLGGGEDAYDVNGLTAIGIQAGKNTVAHSSLGQVASVGISAEGSYTGACPTIAFSAPSSGTTATGTLVCSYSASAATYTPIYVSGLPSGSGYNQFTFAATTSGSTTMTVVTATGITAGETVFSTAVPAGDTVASISGDTVTLTKAATATNTSLRTIFGTAPTITITCSGSCTGGSGFSGVAFLTGAGINNSVYVGNDAGYGASSQGGINTVVGSNSVLNAASGVTSLGLNNAANDTGDTEDLFLGQGNSASGSNQDILAGYGSTCTGCTNTIALADIMLSPSTPISNAVMLMPNQYETPKCGSCIQFDGRVLVDTSGNLDSDLLVSSVGASSIASASTIAPSAYITHITGTTAINTITPPTVFSGALTAIPFTGCIDLIPDGQWSTTTAGNISNAITITPQEVGVAITGCYDGSKWYLSLPSTTYGTVTFTAGTNVTSAACASGYTCTNNRGEVTIVTGSSFTAGTLTTVNFSTTLQNAPGLCTVTDNSNSGITTFPDLGHNAASTSGFNITTGAALVSTTLNVDYSCQP